MARYHSNSAILVGSLYCSEEHWEEEEETVEDYFENEVRGRYYCDLKTMEKPRIFLEQDLFWEEDELVSLLSKEQPNKLHKHLLAYPSLDGARRNAVEWMLTVSDHYCFSALTAVLSVDYLDRFLWSFHFQREKPWMIQLAAVACLSLAAKMEETHVPLLLDLQVNESRYLFEAKTIKRTEILVLSTLQWRMNPVTPLSFLDYITRRLGLRDRLCIEFLRRSEQILLSIITDSRFMSFLPSVIANAIVLHLVCNIEPSLAVEYQNQLFSILNIDKAKVDDCYRLILEKETSGSSHDHHWLKRKFGSLPSSPNGVTELHFNSDSSNESWGVATLSDPPTPEPLSKKTKVIHGQLLDPPLKTHSKAADLLGIPRQFSSI